jgi:hypothetical protein
VGQDLASPASYVRAEPLAETFDGTSWKPLRLPTAGHAHFTMLWGVSCTSPGVCIAAGEQDGGPLVENLTEGNWTPTLLTVPVGDTSASLQGVSCLGGAIPCVAGGAGIGPSGVYPVIGSN